MIPRGSIVQNHEGKYYIYLKEVDETNCKVAVVEDVMDEFSQNFVAKVTSLIVIPKNTVTKTDFYPNYLNQISIT